MSLGRYAAVVVGMAVVSLAALRPALAADAWTAAAVAAFLAAANSVAAFALVRWTSGRSNVAFFRAVLGGTAIRLGVVLAAAVGAILGGLRDVPFATALLSYFVAFLTLELAVVHRETPAPRPEAGR